MIVFQCALENIRCHVRVFFYYFLWLAFIVTFLFFYTSVQYFETAKDGMFFFDKLLLALCLCISTLCMNAIFLKNRIKHIPRQDLCGRGLKQIRLIFFYEQIIVSSGALIIGLFHGVLFFKLFTVVFIKVTNNQSVGDVSLNIEAVFHTVLLFSVLIFFTLWCCNRFVVRNEVCTGNGRKYLF
ncbi:hypothetical protein BAMA_03565 [Bacillus manliponensis]|uniref:ABC3 transporter permease C-terminal domain-containing protein n=3 Tax=Bacillus manliponensis TaxID=574376 RepID=A0A073JUZ2_9BACI|nr:hypothetical protein BAMA_03565 [Bacillus manliponensis]